MRERHGSRVGFGVVTVVLAGAIGVAGGAIAADAPSRTALFGAVHVHTSYSFDAFTNGTVSRPTDAYAWAKGEAIQGNRAGLKVKLRTPLD
ncbi:MAG: DUF3604 domain-containing protein, partial [Myxococcales bacterium]|nr:DUF3604 domain-containing protein [Myxococcales bacterium]